MVSEIYGPGIALYHAMKFVGSGKGREVAMFVGWDCALSQRVILFADS
jgi:hypothetical protein